MGHINIRAALPAMTLLFSASAAASAAPGHGGSAEPPARIEAARAIVEPNDTLLEVALHGHSTPTLSGSGTTYMLTLPHAAPSARLAAHMISGGLVTRLTLETAPAPAHEVRLCFISSAPVKATLTHGPDRQTVRVRLAALPDDSPAPLRAVAPGLYDIDAYQTEVATLLKSLARDGAASVMMTGTSGSKVTVNLHHVTTEEAIDLLSKAAGLTYHKEGGTYLVGPAKEIDSAYPKPQIETIKPPPAVIVQEIYRCRNIVASELVTTLTSVFDKEALKVSLGASASTPHLDDPSTASVTGIEAATLKGAGASGGGANGGGVATGSAQNGLSARAIILSGEQSVVARALKIARQLDARRQQVKIDVRITDISTDALKQLGVQWNWSQYTVTEQPSNTGATTSPTTGSTTGGATGTSGGSTATTIAPTVNGINFGVFGHTPVSINATVSALEQNNRAKLLAAPSLSLLDGERSFILIGQRLLYPKLIGYTQANTPIFDKEEARVGIYLQVSVQTAADGEITLTLYPQVSVVTGYLNVNGASYPQISTREQQTTIRVRDGQQIIVGGLLHEEELHSIQRVPLLSSLPFFGELFTYRNKTRSKDELVIMLTPQILKD